MSVTSAGATPYQRPPQPPASRSSTCSVAARASSSRLIRPPDSGPLAARTRCAGPARRVETVEDARSCDRSPSNSGPSPVRAELAPDLEAGRASRRRPRPVTKRRAIWRKPASATPALRWSSRARVGDACRCARREGAARGSPRPRRRRSSSPRTALCSPRRDAPACFGGHVPAARRPTPVRWPARSASTWNSRRRAGPAQLDLVAAGRLGGHVELRCPRPRPRRPRAARGRGAARGRSG